MCVIERHISRVWQIFITFRPNTFIELNSIYGVLILASHAPAALFGIDLVVGLHSVPILAHPRVCMSALLL